MFLYFTRKYWREARKTKAQRKLFTVLSVKFNATFVKQFFLPFSHFWKQIIQKLQLSFLHCKVDLKISRTAHFPFSPKSQWKTYKCEFYLQFGIQGKIPPDFLKVFYEKWTGKLLFFPPPFKNKIRMMIFTQQKPQSLNKK